MPTHFMYAGKRLIPAPFVQITKVYQKSDEEQIIGSSFSISITGKVLAFMGSPDSTGTFFTGSQYPADESVGETSRLGAIIRKQEALRTLFSIEGQQLEIQSADGSQPLKCNPRVVGIEFNNDLWYQSFDYVITLEADVIYLNGSALGEDSFSNYISSASESWSFDTDESTPEGLGVPRTYRVSHSVSAKGKRFYDDTGTLVQDAWKQAQAFVLPRLGFDASIALSSGVNNLPSYYQDYNYVRNEQIDKKAGFYAVSETFILASGSAVEDFNVSTKTSIDTGITSVSIEGTVTGLELRNTDFSIASLKYTNAVNKFADVQNLTLSRAQTYSNTALNILPLSTTIARNPINGTISYAYEYNNRPSNLFAAAKSEVFNVQDAWGIDSFAPIFVLGRTIGPVIQNLGTHRERTRQFTIEAVFPVASGDIATRLLTNKPSILYASTIQNMVNAMNPAAQGATSVNVANQSTSWDGQRFTYNVEWVFELNQGTVI